MTATETRPVLDRTPPQDIAAEMAVLGGMLLSRRAIGDVTDVLSGADFYRPVHEMIFDAIVDLHNRNEPADTVTVADLLLKRGELGKVGGSAYLHRLMDSVPVAANAGYYAVPVFECSVRRRMIESGTRIVQSAYETTDGADLSAIVDQAQKETHALMPGRDQAADKSQAASVARVLGSVENPTALGLLTGFADLDALTGGLLPGQSVIVAGRPSLGKSTLGLDICRHVSIKLGRPSAFFSLEMGQDEITKRELSAEAGVPLHHLRYNQATDEDWNRLHKCVGSIASAPLHVIDTPGLSVQQIRTESRRMIEKHGLDLIVIDYLQLLGTGTTRRQENRQQEVTEMSRSIKELAKELEVPIISLCQLNRGPEARADKKPMMSDLRESGSLEQDADIIILVHREDFYEPESPRAGEADLIVAKHRNGSTATITVAFQGHYARFADMAQS